VKFSKYNVITEVDGEKSVIFNTLRRKYYILDKEKKDMIRNLKGDLNRESFTVEEAGIIKKLAKTGMVISDDVDELEIYKGYERYLDNQEDTYAMVVKMTLDCNFRCIYCDQLHQEMKIDEQTENSIIKHITKVVPNIKNLQLWWFGGEPLLEMDAIKRMTKKIKALCGEHNVKYSASVTSNGYLIDDDYINAIEELSITKMQITLDGTKEFHDKCRPHENGAGTYEKVIKSLVNLAKKDINLNFRINVNKENYDSINELFEEVPQEYRGKVNVTMANWFQENNKISLFELFKKSIELGYRYENRSNTYSLCGTNRNQYLSVLPNGNLVCCAEIYTNETSYGRLNENGDVEYFETAKFDISRFNEMSPLDRSKCADCVQLPMCVGGCQKARYYDKDYCARLVPEGMGLNEKIKLFYLNDMKYGSEEELIL